MDIYVRTNYEGNVICRGCKAVIEEPVTYVTTATGERYALYICENCGEEHKVVVPKA